MAQPRPTDLVGLKQKFRDFDDEEVYKDVCKAALDPQAQNFVVTFGPHKAKVALDLGLDDFKDLLKWKDPECPVRWINFWNTTEQANAIDFIGVHNGFSRRLRSSILGWDKYRVMLAAAAAKKQRAAEELVEHGPLSEKKDVEQGLNGEPAKQAQSQATQVLTPSASREVREEMINYKIIQESLNYTTTDYGSHFFCFGANWLHRRPTEEDIPDDRLVPPRHWSWFALCAHEAITDTVISVHEAPNYELQPRGVAVDEAAWKVKELQSMRTNVSAVLEQLSEIGINKYSDKFFFLKAIREPLKASGESSQRSSTNIPTHKITETAASNLFYYLFEDYSAVIQVLQSSKSKLQDLSNRVLSSANRRDNSDGSDVIPDLHTLGKDLRLLHHLFDSYKNLFQAILVPPDLEAAETRVVKLEGQARDRFRRLIDRLQLLMLNTIREHIEEKTELSNTYFNLTAQKDSQATARLTRSATLLAKLSVFFLPISFITSFFSIQINELTDSFTARTYWNTLAVTASLSFVCLFFFSKLLMLISDWLDDALDTVTRRVGMTFRKFHEKKE